MDVTLGSLLTEAAAREAVAVAPLVDGHDDLAWEARENAGYSVEGLDVDRAAAGLDPAFHTDLHRLRAAGIGGQFWSVYAPCERRGADAVAYTLEQVDFVHRLVARHPDLTRLCWSGDDVRVSTPVMTTSG